MFRVLVRDMNDKELLNRVHNIAVWQRYGERAPHKPLLILYALGRIRSNQEQFVRFKDAEPKLTQLLEQFGPPRKSYRPDEPFKRLPGDSLWELTYPAELDGKSPIDFTVSEMRRYGVTGGFTSEVYDYLVERSDLIETIVSHLLEQNFPASYHGEIRRHVGLEQAVPLSRSTRPARDPNFRDNVLRAYARNCSVCGSDLRLDDSLFDLEAAHIMWHAAGGPDVVPNGLALCGFHHKAFDRGAWGLNKGDSEFTIHISPDLNGTSHAIGLLLDFEGQSIRLPRNGAHVPDSRFIEWHRREVFRDTTPRSR